LSSAIADSSFRKLQYYGLVVDLLLLGLTRASEIAGPPQVGPEPAALADADANNANCFAVESQLSLVAQQHELAKH
jgi:RNA recognition motif of the spliceosomal PrP8